MRFLNFCRSNLKTLFKITIVGFLVAISISFISNSYLTNEKQKGAHVFGSLNATNLQSFKENNYNWITLVPYCGQENVDSPTLVYHRGNRLDVVRRDSIWKTQIEVAHALGFKVFLKPHIWMHNPSEGKWRSDIFPTNEGNWNTWQKNYREFILLYAKIAEENNVEMFCVGTELSRLTLEKSDFWKTLIQDVRRVYSGKLTYAANWRNEFEKITFWEDLDYIGIQAYFPLTKNNNPSVKQISEGWEKHLLSIKQVHEKFNRNILFTEMGYKSTADSAIKPWEWIENYSDHEDLISYETQANCYKAFFDQVWGKDWFEGVHIWQLRSDYIESDAYLNLDFTPQGKPAEAVISKGFE